MPGKPVFYYDENDNLRVFTPHHFDYTKRPKERTTVTTNSPSAAPKSAAVVVSPPKEVNFHDIESDGRFFPKSLADGSPPPNFKKPTPAQADNPKRTRKQKKKLRIKDSLIVGAGKGLFAGKSTTFNPGDHITTYGGFVLPNQKVADASKSHYLITDADGRIWDAEYIEEDKVAIDLGRWINDPQGTSKTANAEFVLKEYDEPYEVRVEVVAIKTIKPNEEILIDYNGNFWDEEHKQ